MVFVRIPAEKAAPLADFLKERSILVLPGARMRLVTHLDVDAASIDHAVAAFRAFFAR
jgi:threonine aldolase